MVDKIKYVKPNTVLKADVYRYSILLGVIVTLTLFAVRLVFGVVNTVIIAYPILALVLLLFYFYNKKDDKSELQYIILSTLLYISIDLTWLLGDGSTTINILVYFLFIIYTIMIIPPRYINYWTMFIVANFVLVVFLEYNLKIPLNYYDTQASKKLFIIGYFLAAAASTMTLLLFFRKRFDMERIILSRRTEELNEIREFFEDQNSQIESYIKDIEKLNQSINQKNLELEKQQNEITDATRNLERKVKQKTKRLETRIAEQDTIFYQSSHDFRRPLASLLGLKEVSRLINNEESRKLLELVGDTATEMDAMLGKFLTLYNINHYRERTERIEIEKILNLLGRRVEKHGGTLEIINRCSESGRVSRRNVLLQPILENLVENSLFYKKPNETVRIRIELIHNDGQCRVCVTDNGLGIPEEYHDKVFGIYFKGSSISKGNGLGLYVVRRAIEVLKGSVILESKKGEFTKITILYKEEKDQ